MSNLPRGVVINNVVHIRHVPRADRVRLAEALINSRSPDLVRFRDELRMRDGTFKVCRVVSDPRETSSLVYVCTDGTRTRMISAEEVGTFEHYRDGEPVHASEKKRLRRESLL